MLITEKGIGDGERFVAFEQQRVNERNSGPHVGYTALAQAAFDAVQICAGDPRQTIVFSLIAERQCFDLIVTRRVEHYPGSRNYGGGKDPGCAEAKQRVGSGKASRE